MKYHTLGRSLDVSAIGIGCMPMINGGNITYGQADRAASTKTIHEAIDLGVTLLDTAEMYGPFTNEELVEEAIRGRRDGLVIATKFAATWNGDQMTGLDGGAANMRRGGVGPRPTGRRAVTGRLDRRGWANPLVRPLVRPGRQSVGRSRFYRLLSDIGAKL